MKTTSPLTPAETFARLEQMIGEIRVGMLTTLGEDRDFHSRPMATLDVDAVAGALWFLTADDSLKAREIHDDWRVGLTYSDAGRSVFVALSGTAQLIEDRAKARELWSPMMKAFFPGGVDDPRLVLLRVVPERVEYWDASENRMQQLFNLAKAAVTGEPPQNLGDHGKAHLN
ncbi:MAG: pyridoxamine 5'-phosphate oxidase family protein [Opitutus sp.]|nr:pyridoxamine 5'-phosphate oxidase family protein [Opitutus sp.]